MTPGGISVMLVEDAPEFRELVAILLSHDEQYRVRAAAIEHWLEDVCDAPPDIVLLDLALDGTDATEHIPSIVAACPTTMVAALTSLPASEQETATRAAGAFAYYEKTALPHLPTYLEQDHDLFRRALAGEDVVAPLAAARTAPATPTSETWEPTARLLR